MNWFTDIVSGGVDKVIDSVGDGLDKLFTSDEEKLKAQNMLEQIRSKMKTTIIQSLATNQKLKADVIMEEIKGESFIQRNWRPITMLLFAYIIANEYIIAPYIEVLFNVNLKPKALDPEMWSLLKLGMGGYIGALGVKKVVDGTKWAK